MPVSAKPFGLDDWAHSPAHYILGQVGPKPAADVRPDGRHRWQMAYSRASRDRLQKEKKKRTWNYWMDEDGTD